MTRNRAFGLLALCACAAGTAISCMKAAEDEDGDISVACGPGTRIEGNRCIADVGAGGSAGESAGGGFIGAAGAAGGGIG